MTETGIGRLSALTGLAIIAIVTSLFALSYIISVVLGFPPSLVLPTAARLGGGILAAAGLALAAWVFRHRSPTDMIVSTHVTLAKLVGRIPAAEKASRTEPLVVSGPQRYVRNPLYLSVVVMTLGWAILTAQTYILVAAATLLVWFGLVLVPFEERELRVLFGEQWERYSQATPMLIPFTKRKKNRNPQDAVAEPGR